MNIDKVAAYQKVIVKVLRWFLFFYRTSIRYETELNVYKRITQYRSIFYIEKFSNVP